jgi:unsaturated chondroitin disaccharide hydrolase
LTRTDFVSTETKNFRAAFDLCVRKTRGNIQALADNPKSWALAKDGHYAGWDENFFAISNWTSSFITGMALLAWDRTEEEHFLQQTLRLERMYSDKVFTHHADTMHDLGFLYSLYSVAIFKLTGADAHREVGLRAAEVLAARFMPKGKFIRAWGRMDAATVGTIDTGLIKTDNLAIIDCMMNLPLLFWAGEQTGDKKFYDIAVAHADTTLKHFVRADDSVFHAFRFDLATGKPAGGDNYCGHATPSHWARGTTWAIYGFALAYKYTQDERYLDAAKRIARKFISLLDDEVVPVWDFRLTNGVAPVRDASAAAIAASALQELAALDPREPLWNDTAEKFLTRLCSDDYLDADLSRAGIVRHAQVGDGKIPGTNLLKGQNVFTSWGDYYFMEALAKKLFQAETWW